jgi:anti-sigma-K factor RskA
MRERFSERPGMEELNQKFAAENDAYFRKTVESSVGATKRINWHEQFSASQEDLETCVDNALRFEREAQRWKAAAEDSWQRESALRSCLAIVSCAMVICFFWAVSR